MVCSSVFQRIGFYNSADMRMKNAAETILHASSKTHKNSKTMHRNAMPNTEILHYFRIRPRRSICMSFWSILYIHHLYYSFSLFCYSFATWHHSLPRHTGCPSDFMASNRMDFFLLQFSIRLSFQCILSQCFCIFPPKNNRQPGLRVASANGVIIPILQIGY